LGPALSVAFEDEQTLGRGHGAIVAMRSLEMLDLSETGLVSLPGVFLWCLPRLRELRAAFNRLTELPKPATPRASKVPKISRIDFSNNQIVELPPGLAQLLPALVEADFDGNPLVDSSVAGAWWELEELLASRRAIGGRDNGECKS
jgi:Leucine-rich repeat (LRR) protein